MAKSVCSQQLLAIEVGNTHVKFGTFVRSDASELLDESVIPCSIVDTASSTSAVVPTSTNDSSEADQIFHQDVACNNLVQLIMQQITCDSIGQVVLAGSNASLRDRISAVWPSSHWPLLTIRDNQQIPMVANVDEPTSVGIDRLLACVAARQLVSDQAPLVVVDSGTATTVNLVTQEGIFRGGAILPGLRLSAQALHQYTDRLPQIDANQLFTNDDIDAPLPGRNTDDAIKSGLFWGQLGAIREIAQALSIAAMYEYGATEAPLIVMTGGGGRQLHNELADAIFIDRLTLKGLAIVGHSLTLSKGE